MASTENPTNSRDKNQAKPQDIIVDEKLLAKTTETFSLFDKDEDGSIELIEIGPALRSIGFNPSEKQIQELMVQYELDGHGSGLIEFTNFLILVSKFKREGDSYEEILEAFRVFDPNLTGLISVADLKRTLTNIGECLTDREADNMISFADVDRKGRIRYMDFARTLLANMQD